MRYKIVLKVFAESEATQESVELCPGGIVEEASSIPLLDIHLDAITAHGWGEMSGEEIGDFLTRVKYEAETVARILDKREQAVVPKPASKRKKPKRKSGLQGTVGAPDRVIPQDE